MTGLKPDKLDHLLIKAFQEEARNIVPPSSSQLWDNLQQQLEKRELRKTRDEQKEKPGGEDALPEKNTGKTGWKFTWKFRYLTGLAAACLLIIIVAKTPGGSALRGLVSGMFPSMKSESPGITLSMQDAQTGETPSEDTLEANENVGLYSSGESQTFATGEPMEGRRYAMEDGEPPAGTRDMLPRSHPGSDAVLGLGEDTFAEIHPAESESGVFMEIAGLTPEEASEDTVWHEENEFHAALKELRQEASGRIFYFSALPAGNVFRVGIATKTEHSLLQLYQEFEGQDGKIFTFTQLFAEDNTAAEETFSAAKETGAPYSTNSFTGYLQRSAEGMITLTWKDGNSVLTLSGHMEEAQLKDYVSYLSRL